MPASFRSRCSAIASKPSLVVVTHPAGKYGYAIRTACESLDTIQTAYAADCAETAACEIPVQAVGELQDVLDRLRVAFSDANLVQPYPDDLGQFRE